MYAIFELGGRQYKAEGSKVVKMDRIEAEPGAILSFDKVLALHDGEALQVGTPYVAGVTVTGRVVQQGKDRKIVVMKYKPKKHYRVKRGHRTQFTAVQITSISK
jgi:large subunit ribosomal protein L21